LLASEMAQVSQHHWREAVAPLMVASTPMEFSARAEGFASVLIHSHKVGYTQYVYIIIYII
jgi:hypothetical protein